LYIYYSVVYIEDNIYVQKAHELIISTAVVNEWSHSRSSRL